MLTLVLTPTHKQSSTSIAENPLSGQRPPPGPKGAYPVTGRCPAVDPRLQCAAGHFIDPAGCLQGCRPGLSSALMPML